MMRLRRTCRRPGGGAGPADLSIPSGNVAADMASGQLGAERVPSVATTDALVPPRV